MCMCHLPQVAVCVRREHSVHVYFLDGCSGLALSPQQRNLLLVALTAAGRVLVSRWVPPHLVTGRLWGLSLLSIVSVELSAARVHGAEARTLGTWSAAFDVVESFVSSF